MPLISKKRRIRLKTAIDLIPASEPTNEIKPSRKMSEEISNSDHNNIVNDTRNSWLVNRSLKKNIELAQINAQSTSKGRGLIPSRRFICPPVIWFHIASSATDFFRLLVHLTYHRTFAQSQPCWPASDPRPRARPSHYPWNLRCLWAQKPLDRSRYLQFYFR
jgi:hypothetical protein